MFGVQYSHNKNSSVILMKIKHGIKHYFFFRSDGLYIVIQIILPPLIVSRNAAQRSKAKLQSDAERAWAITIIFITYFSSNIWCTDEHTSCDEFNDEQREHLSPICGR